jgi:hypothetical protein
VEHDVAAVATSQRYDLRTFDVSDEIAVVERALRTPLLMDEAVIKRRSIGAPTPQGTWVRIELRGAERLDGQGWGAEAASQLRGVAAPRWHSGMSWVDQQRAAVWRADVTDRVTAPPIGRAAGAAGLPSLWWDALRRSLAALAGSRTTRLATPDCEPITQHRITEAIDRAFPGAVDSTVDEWTVAHADLGWANITGPELWLLDWEDFGRCPRGFDAARLWSASLGIPELAGRVHDELREDLDSRTGRIMALFHCAIRIAAGDDDPSGGAAKLEADRLQRLLRR